MLVGGSIQIGDRQRTGGGHADVVHDPSWTTAAHSAGIWNCTPTAVPTHTASLIDSGAVPVVRLMEIFRQVAHIFRAWMLSESGLDWCPV